MGQYFICVNLDKQEWIQCDGFAKLTESAWIGNGFVETIETFLSSEWKNDRIVWAGDYMVEGQFLECENKSQTLYSFADKNYMQRKVIDAPNPKRYLINSTLRQYVDKDKVRSNDGWRVHPLPILTAASNGRGGGDYYPISDSDAAYVGTWAGHRIYASSETPEGYYEIIPDFYER